MPKYNVTCTTCEGRKLLWLGGKDFVECPDCEGAGTHLIYEQIVKQRKHILVAGLKQ